jgi:MoaA/NifB/PqqE/SkfB family radical SAM enzyme
MAKRKLYGTVIVTYRCNAKCNMCDCFKDPTKPEDEITLEVIRKLPEMVFTNITGGEPFIRKDMSNIVRELYKKSDRIVISTNGYFTDRIIALCKEFPNVGIRISIEGLQETNDAIRGIPDGFNKGYTTLKTLVEMGHPDVGFGMTVQDMNCEDLVPLYKLSDELNMEFATATLHNSFYFRKKDNKIENKLKVAQNFEKLVNELLKSKSPKKWFRAYFNHGLINYIYGQERLLPCDMSSNAFFIDPFCDIIPCNGMEEKAVMGNLKEMSWDELWTSDQANRVRECTKKCDRNCWMIGSAAPAMERHIWIPGWWVIKHKFLFFFKKEYCIYENKNIRNYFTS